MSTSAHRMEPYTCQIIFCLLRFGFITEIHKARNDARFSMAVVRSRPNAVIELLEARVYVAMRR